MANPFGRPRIYNSVEDFEEAINSYFDKVEEENKASLEKNGKLCRSPNIAALCSHMGLLKSVFYEYAKRKDSNDNVYSNSVKMASQRLELFKLENASLGMIREITTIFDLKNNHGYVDKQEVITTQTDDRLTPEQVKERLEEMKKKKVNSKKT